jgi:hypothetical protein
LAGLLLASACGGKVTVDVPTGSDGTGGASSGGTSSSGKPNSNDVLADCNAFCETYDKRLGCTDFTCVKGCTDEYEAAGSCAPAFAAFIACVAHNTTSCTLPPACETEYDALTACYGTPD